MAGTKGGGKNARDTNYKKYGKDFYAKIGSMGGKVGTTGGFWHTKYVLNRDDLVSKYGSIGGKISKRGKAHD